jgi:hypothetical protein
VLHRPKKPRTSKFRTGGPPKVRKLITFTAFSDPVSPDRYEGAPDQINIWREHNRLLPLIGERLEECEREVIIAVRSVESFTECAPFVLAPKAYKTTLESKARTLRKAATFPDISGELRHRLEEEATMLDRRAAVKQPRIVARKQAVCLAERILTDFGGKAPGLTQNSPWEILSQILLGVPGADVFETMRLSRKTVSRP